MDPLQQDPNLIPQDANTPVQTPESPSAPMAATSDPSVNMTPEEMRADLDKLMSAINDKMNTFNGQKMSGDSQLTQAQNSAIAALFDILSKNGVDLADPNSVTTFLNQLQQDNPEGYKIFEDSINNLLGQKEVLDKIGPPDNFAEPAPPLDPMGQLGAQPVSPPGIDLNNPMNQVAPIPGSPGRG